MCDGRDTLSPKKENDQKEPKIVTTQKACHTHFVSTLRLAWTCRCCRVHVSARVHVCTLLACPQQLRVPTRHGRVRAMPMVQHHYSLHQAPRAPLRLLLLFARSSPWPLALPTHSALNPLPLHPYSALSALPLHPYSALSALPLEPYSALSALPLEPLRTKPPSLPPDGSQPSGAAGARPSTLHEKPHTKPHTWLGVGVGVGLGLVGLGLVGLANPNPYPNPKPSPNEKPHTCKAMATPATPPSIPERKRAAVESGGFGGGRLERSRTRGSGWAPSGPASPLGLPTPPTAANRALRRHRSGAWAAPRVAC
jgi:hypothetical protein